MKHRLVILVSLFITAIRLHAECDPSTLAKAVEACTVAEIVERTHDVRLADRAAANQKAIDAAKAAPAKTKAASEKVVDSNRATTAPDTFASRLHNSYEDFLVPLSFAINKVEESKDGRALTVRFNPLRLPPLGVGLTATAAKPSLLEKIKTSIPEAKRAETVAALEKKLGDLDDITLAAALTFQTKLCGLESRPATKMSSGVTEVGRCVGRNPATYRDLLSEGLASMPTLLEKLSSEAAEKAATELAAVRRRVGLDNDQVPLKNVPEAARREIYELARVAGTADVADTLAYLEEFEKNGVEHMATLVDNQPQLAINVTYHQMGEFSGPNEQGATLEYQVGRWNVNKVRRGCDASFGECLVRKLGDKRVSTTASDKFVLSASWKRTDPFKVEDLGEITVEGFQPVGIKRTNAFSAKAQWGRKLGIKVKDNAMRFDVSTEFKRTSEAGERNLNRFVTRTTLTVPYGKTASFPVSLTYANKNDFLADERDRLSVHFGISYRLPWEPKD